MIVDGVSVQDLTIWGDQLYKRYRWQVDFMVYFGVGALAAYGFYILYKDWEKQNFLNQTGNNEEISPVKVESKPIDLKITENEAACSFIKTQMHATISDINFTRDKEKIRKLKGKINALEKMKKQAKCP